MQCQDPVGLLDPPPLRLRHGPLDVVTGYGDEAGAALPAHPGIRTMSFTGSPATGTAVMEACARNLIPL
ncbi:aldehyde dehydrogenase family protein [Streptomyces sp. NPDC013157]|uniref:aldehyde dehydrogenase family protein n=1 Tax=Streptomyces sp. NPDC013157 TaxID=3364861 RepID=UPI00369FED44